MRTKKTNVDFSNHIYQTETYVSSKGDKIIVDSLKIPDSHNNYVKFTNNGSTMLVEGDRYNWFFNRSFYPSKDGYVSVPYWIEKLKTASHQSAGEFSVSKTKEAIGEIINDFEDYYGDDEITKQWFTELYNEMDYMESEHEYVQKAFFELPDNLSAEDIPLCKQTYHDLKVVFDAWEEICKRKNNE